MFSYFPHFLPTSIAVIGAGGTGSRLLPPLVQLVKTCLRKHNPAAMLDKCDVYVIDGDIVEEKNLSRQNFISPDVGKNKALVVAERYARAFGINVIPCTEFLTPKTKGRFDGPAGEILFKTVFENAVVIFCVDSARARKEILAFMNKFCTSNLFVIDAGNEDDFGQIKLFTGHLLGNSAGNSRDTLVGLPKEIPASVTVGFIPYDVEYYRNLGDSAAERSCADLPQTLAINTMMATLILCTLQNFMQLRPMNYDGQSFSLTGSTSTSYNTPRRWAQRIIEWNKTQPNDVTGFLTGQGRVQTGTALNPYGEENGDIFSRLRVECSAVLHASGMKLLADGSVEEIAPPPPPMLKTLKEVVDAPVLKAIPVVEIPVALPEAPPMVRRVARRPFEVTINDEVLEVPITIDLAR